MARPSDTREPSSFEWSLGRSGFTSRVSSSRPWLVAACGLGALALLGLMTIPAFRDWVGGLIVTVATLAVVGAVIVYGKRGRKRRRR